MKRFTEMLLVDLPEGGRTAKYTSDLINKLGEYETIEEHLGVKMIIVLKAMDQGIYTAVENEDTNSCSYFHIEARDLELNLEGASILSYVRGTNQIYREFFMSDYNKTWSLTKGELL